MSNETKYKAFIPNDENICNFGSGNTPDEAVNEFVKSGAFYDECSALDLPIGSKVKVEVWTAIYKDENESFADEQYDDDFLWYGHDLVESREMEVPNG